MSNVGRVSKKERTAIAPDAKQLRFHLLVSIVILWGSDASAARCSIA